MNITLTDGFDEEVKTSSISIPTYLGRLILRTHHADDTASLASIFSNPISRKHLRFLQPPQGWSTDENGQTSQQWTEQSFSDRVQVQTAARATGKSCVLNIILLASASGEENNRCIGTTGYVTIDGHIGYLGVITDPNTTRLGYATEALHTSICFAFERLGVTTIIMQTDQNNEEMRGWCEKTAGLIVHSEKPKEMNGYTFIQCEYIFSIDQWNHSIKKNLENKMDKFRSILTMHSVELREHLLR